MADEPLIVGIHGLANKPEEKKLSDWWQWSIAEGLRKNEDVQNPRFDYKMVYWRPYLYKYPLHQDESLYFDRLYNSVPSWAST